MESGLMSFNPKKLKRSTFASTFLGLWVIPAFFSIFNREA
jgi:hypothetical protein